MQDIGTSKAAFEKFQVMIYDPTKEGNGSSSALKYGTRVGTRVEAEEFIEKHNLAYKKFSKNRPKAYIFGMYKSINADGSKKWNYVSV